jgi:hypothetical protein
MDSVSKAFTWQKNTRKIAIFCFFLLALNFIFSFISNEIVFQNKNYEHLQFLFSNKVFRFFYREINVYTFGFLGYRFINQNITKKWANIFIYFLVLLDFALGIIGVFHFLFIKNVVLDISYNYLLTFIASPFYFMVFIIFVVYLSNAESKHEAK